MALHESVHGGVIDGVLGLPESLLCSSALSTDLNQPTKRPSLEGDTTVDSYVPVQSALATNTSFFPMSAALWFLLFGPGWHFTDAEACLL